MDEDNIQKLMYLYMKHRDNHFSVLINIKIRLEEEIKQGTISDKLLCNYIRLLRFFVPN
jgi:hypothetical protein